MKRNGYGKSVIAKLKETKVKRNLYYEIKDKIFEEETFNGKIVRSKKMTRVYGLETNVQTREQLIELLKERVGLHKDKFISPTIHKELTGLEIKKNGRIEHSDLSHDDQIFSYLMAIYVWYEGNNLRELWGIEKTQLKTDDNVDDIIDLETGPKTGADMLKPLAEINKNLDTIEQQRLELQLAELSKNKGMLFSEFVTKTRQKEEENLRNLLRDERAKEAYARYYGIPVEAVDVNVGKSAQDETYNTIPKSLFTDFDKDESELGNGSIYRELNRNITSEYMEDENY